MGESGLVEKDGLLELGVGRDTESSAALGNVSPFLTWTMEEQIPFSRLIETPL